MDDKWIDSIKDKMADYEVVPPAGLLDAIEAKVRAGKMRNRRVFGAVAASVALIGGVSVALIPDIPDTSHGHLVSDKVGEEAGKEAGKEGKGFINHVAEATVVTEQAAVSPRSGKKTPESRPYDRESSSGEVTEIEYRRDDMLEEAVAEARTDIGAEASPHRAEDDRYSDHLSAVLPVDLHSGPHEPVSVGVATSANGLESVLDDDGIESRLLPASAPLPHTRMGGGFLGESNSYEPPTPTYIELFDHRLPLRASIDFSWSVGYGLCVGTGLTYSYLRSDIRYGYSDSPLFKASQSLHFIGIPVNVRYTAWSLKKLGIYASAGFMAEKCIGGQIKKEYPQDPGYSYVGCGDRPFQFSFNAAVGVQYSLAGSCSVFIEPGVGVYLKNVSRLRTIYSERPVTFNVNVGLRFGR